MGKQVLIYQLTHGLLVPAEVFGLWLKPFFKNMFGLLSLLGGNLVWEFLRETFRRKL